MNGETETKISMTEFHISMVFSVHLHANVSTVERSHLSANMLASHECESIAEPRQC